MPFTPHPALHPLFETLSYTVGYWIYRLQRRTQGDHLAEATRWNIIAAAAVGALLGSRILGLAEELPRWLHDHSFRAAMLLAPGGKTIVGGWLAVELTKRLSGIRTRTGDLFAVPLCLSIATGRIGCFLAGLDDDTYGKASTLPWAVNFGDGIPRHPTQLYELLFLLLLAAALAWRQRRPNPAASANRPLKPSTASTSPPRSSSPSPAASTTTNSAASWNSPCSNPASAVSPSSPSSRPGG